MRWIRRRFGSTSLRLKGFWKNIRPKIGSMSGTYWIKPVHCRDSRFEDVAGLMAVHSQDLLDELFHTAKSVKEEIYGNRIVLFAPLYISNLCSNECPYCAFRQSNKEAIRRALNPDEIWQETKILLRQGHKRVLMVAGEAYPGSGIDYVLEFIDAIYGAEENGSRIRRVNVNLAPLSVEGFRRLKERNIGTFQLFQETYHRPTYGRVHLAGPKKDLDWRASTTWAWGCSTGYMTGGSKRWRSWPTSRILRSGLGSRLSYHQRDAHRTGHRVGFGLPAAVHLERSRFSQACRHIAPCRPVRE